MVRFDEKSLSPHPATLAVSVPEEADLAQLPVPGAPDPEGIHFTARLVYLLQYFFTDLKTVFGVF